MPVDQKSPAWDMQPDIVRMYVEEGLTLREIGEKLGFSRQTACNILQDAGVSAAQKGKKPHKRRTAQIDGEVSRLYVEESKSISDIAKFLHVPVNAVTESLREQGIAIKKGGMWMIVFPQLRKLKVGESVELPRLVSKPPRQTYVRYYEMAKTAGVKVSVRNAGPDTVRVTRKA